MSVDAGREWQARHFDGETPAPRVARVSLEPGAMLVSSGEAPVRRWPLESIVVVSGGGRAGPVQLELRGEPIEAFIVTEPDFLPALEAAGGGRRLPRLSAPPTALPAVAALALAVVVFLFAAWRWGVPALAAEVAERIPPSWEHQLGTVLIDELAPDSRQVHDPIVTRPVRDAFARLLTAAPGSCDSCRVIVLRSAMVNAFAAPGGYVVVTTGLLRTLDVPDELAAVLAHEISHLTGRHATRGMLERQGIRLLFHLLSGDDSGAGVLLGAAGTMGELSYSRNDEAEADEGAVALLARAGIPPAALVRTLDGMVREESRAGGAALEFLSTHPATAGRRERARLLAARLGTVPASAALDTTTWRAMRQALAVLRDTPGAR